jgi:hypothetical protein
MAQIAGEYFPAFFHVVDEGLRFVLGKNEDFVELGVDAVTKRYIDKPIYASKRNRRFGPVGGKRHEPLTSSAGHYDCQYVFH